MNISFDLYNLFYYVCEFKSISKTANYFYVSQPSVTKKIKELENSIGQTLIIRKPTGVEITEYGMKLFDAIKEPVEQLNHIEHSFTTTSENFEGTIKIVAGDLTIKYYLLNAMSKLNKKYPKLKFQFSHNNDNDAMNQLHENDCDMIFLTIGENDINYPNVVYKKLFDLHDKLYISDKIAYKTPNMIYIKNLDNYQSIAGPENYISRKFIQDIFEKEGKSFFPTYELNNLWIVKEYVKLGMGIGIVPEEFKDDDFIEVKTDVEFPTREIGYYYKKNSNVIPILNEFIHAIKEDNN